MQQNFVELVMNAEENDMQIMDYTIENGTGLLRVAIKCSKCGNTFEIKSNKLSKCFMGVCPHCANIEIERQATGEVPAAVIKSLIDIDRMTGSLSSYTVEGQSLREFLMATYDPTYVTQQIPEDFKLSGVYRLKNIFGTIKFKKLLDTNSFPDFETFMRWSVKHGYRDWKTLKLDSNGKYSVGSTWEVKNSSTNIMGKLQTIIDTTLKDVHTLSVQVNDLADENADSQKVRGALAEIARTLTEQKAKLL